jgi:hypothetical protein
VPCSGTQQAKLHTSMRFSSYPCILGKGKFRTGRSISRRARQGGAQHQASKSSSGQDTPLPGDEKRKKGFVLGRIVSLGEREGASKSLGPSLASRPSYFTVATPGQCLQQRHIPNAGGGLLLSGVFILLLPRLYLRFWLYSSVGDRIVSLSGGRCSF